MNYKTEDLKILVKDCKSIADLMRKLGYNSKGGGVHTRLKKKIVDLGIDISHFKGQGHGIGGYRIKLSDILVENSTYTNNHNLKQKLLNTNLLKYVCETCGNTGQWLNKKLVLHLDHKNGVNCDNRLENLRLLCPNCHSQTATYSGKNVKR